MEALGYIPRCTQKQLLMYWIEGNDRHFTVYNTKVIDNKILTNLRLK